MCDFIAFQVVARWEFHEVAKKPPGCQTTLGSARRQLARESAAVSGHMGEQTNQRDCNLAPLGKKMTIEQFSVERIWIVVAEFSCLFEKCSLTSF